MVNYARIQAHIDRGKGIAAKKLGPPFTAYRIVSYSNGDFPGGWLNVVPSFPLFRRRLSSENKIDLGIKNMALWQDIIADMSRFVVGDVFVSVDPVYAPGVSYGDDATQQAGSHEFNGICLAWHPPVAKAVGARLDRLVTIWRPSTTTAINPEGSTSWKSTLVNDQPLVLVEGVYSFQTPGTVPASAVPAGLVGHNRGGEAPLKDVPGEIVKPAKFFVYVPPLPGYLPREGDAVIDNNGTRYVVTSPWEQTAGVAGYQLMCDRKVGPPG